MALESDLFMADSQRDKLTELKNRFAFQSDWQRHYRKIFPLSIIMCDIDFFKKVNDTYGHNAGDAVLVHVAKILQSEVRACDGVYRWGGEEFIIVLEGSKIADAQAVAEKIRLAVKDSVCHFEGRNILITMSFGCVEVDPALDVETNIKIADARLYRAKKTGRNKVVAC